MAYCPQSTGAVERMGGTPKSQLGKLCQEAHLQWDQLLPMPLLRIRWLHEATFVDRALTL
jgi:hypothetical protein